MERYDDYDDDVDDEGQMWAGKLFVVVCMYNGCDAVEFREFLRFF